MVCAGESGWSASEDTRDNGVSNDDEGHRETRGP